MRLECWHTLTAELAAVRLMVGELDLRLATNDFSKTWGRNSWIKMTGGFLGLTDMHITVKYRLESAEQKIKTYNISVLPLCIQTLISPSLAKCPRAAIILGIAAARVSCTVSSCRLVIRARHGNRLTRYGLDHERWQEGQNAKSTTLKPSEAVIFANQELTVRHANLNIPIFQILYYNLEECKQ